MKGPTITQARRKSTDLFRLALGHCLLSTLGLASNSHAQFLDYADFQALFNEPVTTSVTANPQRDCDNTQLTLPTNRPG